MEMNTELFEKLKPLLMKLHSKNVVPFIGAGFSRFFGYPLWTELLEYLIKELEIEENITSNELSKFNPLQVAESIWLTYKNKALDDKKQDIQEESCKYKNANCRENMLSKSIELQFNKKICMCLEKFKNEIGNARIDNDKADEIKKINYNKFDFHKIITTNYDETLEKIIFDNYKYSTLYPRSKIELNYNDSSRTIYKIHGDINHEESIILTNSQYYDFMSNINYHKNRLYTIFASNTILMLGYGFSDINVHEIYFQFLRDYKESLIDLKCNARIYLVIRSDEKSRPGYNLYKTFLEGNGFCIIDECAELYDFINILIDYYDLYVHSLTVNDIFDADTLAQLYNIITKLVRDPEKEVKELNREQSLNVIKLINKNFKEPKILYSEKFQIQHVYNLENEKEVPEYIGIKLLEIAIEIVKKYDDIASECEYRKLVLNSLIFSYRFTVVINDYYRFPEPFKCFMELCSSLIFWYF